MTRQNQTNEERHYLDAFLNVLGIRAYTSEKLDPPKPDFRVSVDQTSVGIEVTGYHSVSSTSSGHPRRVVEEEWERLRSQLMDRVEATPSLTQIHATLIFRELGVPSRRKQVDFIDHIITCAIAHIDKLPTSVTDFRGSNLLSAYLKELRLKRIRCSMSWDWNHNVAWLETDPSAFLKCVTSKVTNNYDRDGIDELWLLIVSGPNLSQAMGIDLHYHLSSMTEVDNLLRKSAFQKLYIFQYMFDVAYEWPGWRKIGLENFRGEKSPTTGSSVP